VQSARLAPYGFLAFVLSQSCLISYNFAGAYKTAESLSAELSRQNEILEQRVAERTQELELLASTDALTSAHNRRFGIGVLEKELELSVTKRYPVTVCFLDINDLKKVNDEYGHREGDALIRCVAGILRTRVRANDFVCRMGGDEFLLVLPQCTLTGCDEIWKDINGEIDMINKSGQYPYHISLSYGSAEYDADRHTGTSDLISEADAIMYRCKRAMKNFV